MPKNKIREALSNINSSQPYNPMNKTIEDDPLESSFSKLGKSLVAPKDMSVEPIRQVGATDSWGNVDTTPTGNSIAGSTPLAPTEQIKADTVKSQINNAISGEDKKENRKEIVKNFKETGLAPAITKKEEKKLDYILSDPNKVEQRVKEDSGVAGVFAQALLGFLPTIAGAILGGDEGGAAGAQVGLNALGSYSQEIGKQQAAAFKEKELGQQGFQEAEKLRSQEQRDVFQESSANERLKMQLGVTQHLERQKAIQERQKGFADNAKDNLTDFKAELKEFRMSKPFIDMAATSSAYESLVSSYNSPSNTKAREFSILYNFMKLHDPTSAVLTSEFQSAKEALGAATELVRQGKFSPRFKEDLKKALTDKGVSNEYLSSLVNTAKNFVKGRADALRVHTARVQSAGDLYGVPEEYRNEMLGTEFLAQQERYSPTKQVEKSNDQSKSDRLKILHEKFMKSKK